MDRSPVYILGGAQSDFARNWNREGKHFADVMRETVLAALDAAKLEPRSRFDACYLTRTSHYTGDIHAHECAWVGNEFWGNGIATQALTELLRTVEDRPLYASAASDNAASLRVLEKCGFRKRGSAKAFAKARGAEIDEVFFELTL